MVKINPQRGGIAEVFLMAYPTAITMMGHTVTGIVDTMMVGRLGTSELAAVGYMNFLFFTLIAVFMGAVQIVNTFSSQSVGADDCEGAARWAWQSIYISLLSWPALILIGIALPQILAVMGPSEKIQEIGVPFGRMKLYVSGFFLMLVALIFFFRGIGKVKIPMYLSLSYNVVNIFLDYALIFGKFGLPKLGVMGAAWAFVITSLAATVAHFAIFLSPKINAQYKTWRAIKPRFGMIRRMLRVGLPAGVQGFLDVAAFNIFIAFIGRMGDAALAANQAALQVGYLGINMCYGFSIASNTLVGQYVGAKDFYMAERSVFSAYKILFYILFAFSAVVLVFREQLIMLFIDDAAVVSKGSTILFLVLIYTIFDGLAIVTVGALRGAGDTRAPMAMALIASWGIFLPYTYIFGKLLNGGIFGAWCGVALYITLLTIAYLSRFRAGRWKEIKI